MVIEIVSLRVRGPKAYATRVLVILLGMGCPLMAQVAPDVGGFVKANCLACHASAAPAGSIDLEQLTASQATLTAQRTTWDMVLAVIRTHRMPPAGVAKPSEESVAMVSWAIARELANAKPVPRVAAVPPAPASEDWLTFHYDAERTGWARAERTLTRANAGKLKLLWTAQLDAVPTKTNFHSTITDALVVQGVATKQGLRRMAFVASGENNIYALDADKGAVIWKRAFPNGAVPPQAANGSCPNNLNATPVIDKAASTVYFLANDGKVRGLSLADGEDKFVASRAVPAYSRNFSLNLAEGVLFSSTTRGCGGAVSEVFGMNMADPEHALGHFFTSTGKAAGPWGRGGVVKTPYGVVAQTADGAYDPASGRWGNTVIGLNKDARMTDSFTPLNEKYLNAKDFDLGSSSPVVFPFEKWTLVAVAAKEGKIYLLDARHLGGDDHRTPLWESPLYSNESEVFGFNGMWSVMSTYVDAQGQRWLLAPMYGPPAKAIAGSFPVTHGNVVNGALMAFRVVMHGEKPALEPAWISGDLDLPGAAVVANGVIYELGTGDRASNGLRGFGPGGVRPARPAGPRQLPLSEVNPEEPGYEKDAAWRASQLLSPEQGGQVPGKRYSGGRETTHAVLYAFDAATGEELFSSGDAMNSWNHYGGLVVSGGKVFVSTYDARVFCFGVR